MKSIITAILFLILSFPSFAQTSPPQNPTGPGGVAQPCTGLTTTQRSLSPIERTYWIITPTGCTGTPAQLPLVVFVHGYGLKTPADQQAWINRIAKQGNIVVFPRYHGDCAFCDLINPNNFTANAIFSIKDAIAKNASGVFIKPWPLGVQPDLNLGILYFAHSAGALVAANIANRYALNQMPAPTALVLAMAWRNSSMDASMAGIPATTRLLCIVANNDTNVGRQGCDDIWDRTSHIAQRSYVWAYSQNRNGTNLLADHHIPEATNPLNAFDWNMLWKFTDAMQTCVIASSQCSYVYGGGANETGMGNWSDNVPMTPLTVTTTKPTCPQSGMPLGC